MRIGAKCSHLNGEEYLLVHRPKLWREVQSVIAAVDAQTCEAEVMNAAFRRGFEDLGWEERRDTFWVTENERLLRDICKWPAEKQKAAIEEAGREPIGSHIQTDFVKERIGHLQKPCFRKTECCKINGLRYGFLLKPGFLEASNCRRGAVRPPCLRGS